jgi:hypothetical protein
LKRNRILLFVAVAAGMAVAAPSAQAGVLVKTAQNCGTETIEQPFTRWNDQANYILAPNGTVENGSTSWSLSGSSVVAGNEPWYVHGAGERSSLKLPAGASATTGTICVGLDRPTLRFFSKSTSTSLLGSLATLVVSVQVETSVGLVVTLPIGVVLPHSQWQPTVPYAVIANLLPLLPGQYTPVRFVFTAVGGSSWQIDDVYVDPRSKV